MRFCSGRVRPWSLVAVAPFGTPDGPDGFAHCYLQLQQFLPCTHFSPLEAIPLVLQPYALR